MCIRDREYAQHCNVLRLVMHQRICIFPAETLLMLMMLGQNFSSTFVSIFNVLFSRGFEAISFTVAMFDPFPTDFEFF